MVNRLTTVAFDADDTLWHNERHFKLTEARFAELLADHADPALLAGQLLAAERRNVYRYGFGVKGFMLSMIETALEVAGDDLPPRVIREIIEAGHEVLAYPVELLPQAREAVELAAERHRVMLITKGDLIDQERKIVQSGLAELFDTVEIVTDKTPDTYARLLTRHGHEPGQAMMIGNSLKSDVLPMLELGGWGVYVPQPFAWALEAAEAPVGHPRFRELADLGGLAPLLEELAG